MKINYGIYIGNSSASIAKIEAGEICVLKSDTLKDEIPLCVSINKKGNILVGDSAFTTYRNEEISQFETTQNSFIEFTKTLGTDKKYLSSNANHFFSSEELLAEVIKSLLSFEKSTIIKAAVLTIPATYKLNQIEALRQSAKLAGLKQVEFIKEPVAATMAYSLDNKKKDGFWLVFDFGSRTFNAALLKVEDGIQFIIDTESENYLGGENLNFAIVDKIIMPYIEQNYAIDSILEDDIKKQILRNAMKFYAKETRIKLSFNETYDIYSDIGDNGEDDNGEEIELDITLTQADLEKVLMPVFQKAIDISKKLLERNNLKPSTLYKLVLVGKETYSPVLRNLLESQICMPDITIEPENAIVKGAALYASTIDVSDEIEEKTKDNSKIQLEIGYEKSTVELEEFVTLKILTDKTECTIPEKVYAEITRSDKAWSSGKVEINEIGEVIETQLIEGKTNGFNLALFDEKGNILESEPKEFTVIQGSKIGNATLAYNIGIEIKKRETGKIVFETISGLEKNKPLPAVGSYNRIKTDKPLRPGMESDFIKIPIFEGDHEAGGTRAIYNNHVTDIIISGADLPALLPENSDVDLTIRVDLSEGISVVAYFPYLDFSFDATLERTVQSIETNWLSNEIRKAKGSIEELKDEGVNNVKVQKAETEIAELERKFENNKNDVDSKQEILTNLRKTLKTIDELVETYSIGKKEKISLKQVEDLLFDLGTDSKISSEKFKTIYELLQTELKQNEINELFKELESYE